MFRQYFRHFDTEKLQWITREQLNNGIDRLALHFSAEEKDAIFNYLDKSGNGYIDYVDFC